MDEKEKRELEKKVEEKEKEIPWYQRLNPIVLGIAVVLGIILFQRAKEDSSSYIWIAALIAILYFMSKAPKAMEESIITPKEAELLVERECERKKRWGQFGGCMAKYYIGPVSELQHKDGRGLYYDVGVMKMLPDDIPEYYVAKVYARGLEKGFVTLSESIGSMTGREKVPERTIIPEWLHTTKQFSILEKLMFRER